jgi:hypothetical protein
MKKTLHLIAFIFLLGVGKLFAQDALVLAFPEDSRKPASNVTISPAFEFRASDNELALNAVTKEMAGEHPFGDLVAKKIYLLEAKYTYQISIVPGNPQTKTVIRKPVIYDAVQKIEHHLKKSVKKGDVSLDVAEADFNKVLDVAFNVLTVDTESFEKAISKSNDINSLTNLFTKRVILLF